MVDINWVISNGWIRDYKWYYSKMEGRDVFVPGTVDRMLLRKNDLSIGYDGIRGIELPDDRGLLGLDVKDREELISAYFNDKNIKYEEGEHPFKGELKRYIARKFDCNVNDVVLMVHSVHEYCSGFSLSKTLIEGLEKLYFDKVFN